MYISNGDLLTGQCCKAITGDSRSGIVHVTCLDCDNMAGMQWVSDAQRLAIAFLKIKVSPAVSTHAYRRKNPQQSPAVFTENHAKNKPRALKIRPTKHFKPRLAKSLGWCYQLLLAEQHVAMISRNRKGPRSTSPKYGRCWSNKCLQEAPGR